MNKVCGAAITTGMAKYETGDHGFGSYRNFGEIVVDFDTWQILQKPISVH